MPPKKTKKPAEKKKPASTPGILDKIKVDNTLKAKFSIQSLSMDRLLMWTLELFVPTTIPRSYHDYRVTMCFDEEPFQLQIADIERQIAGIEATPTLLKDMDKKEINFQKERIAAVMDDREKKKRECRTIEFVTEVQTIDYKNGGTRLKIRVPDAAIPDINDRKTWFSYYRLELKPLEISLPAAPDQSYKDEDDGE